MGSFCLGIEWGFNGLGLDLGGGWQTASGGMFNTSNTLQLGIGFCVEGVLQSGLFTWVLLGESM